MLRPQYAVASCAALLAFALAGCSGSDSGNSNALTDADATPQSILDAWKAAVCDGGTYKQPELQNLEGDEVGGAVCFLSGVGTTENRHQISVWSSESAVEVHMAGRDCANYLYVMGPTWTSGVTTEAVATDLVEAGGQLCEG
ncbi:hypothetical protein ACFQW6_07185 [Nocardioides sp. GCM10028917]|uniref:hypothetical protein n=1 Tax=Nocardioides sp. GCM10028917 TaxID=3273408 RepID=UPI003617F129